MFRPSKKPRKTVKPYGRKFSTQQMGVQVSHRIYAQVSKENSLLGNERRYSGYHPGPVQVERGNDHRGKSDAGSHSSAAVDPTKIFGIQLHGISERAMMIFERHANLKYKFGNRHFWATGYYVSTVGIQEKALRKYIQEQEKQDQMIDKISTKEYENPFKGQAR